uniref:Uncharacterized protein n=1 Tax=Saccharum spontaneum TaxID=62335 RepID=A0A678TPZ9_SACSP|nr:hypothetical protein SS16G14_000014 [Saccharum spontaneum]
MALGELLLRGGPRAALPVLRRGRAHRQCLRLRAPQVPPHRRLYSDDVIDWAASADAGVTVGLPDWALVHEQFGSPLVPRPAWRAPSSKRSPRLAAAFTVCPVIRVRPIFMLRLTLFVVAAFSTARPTLRRLLLAPARRTPHLPLAPLSSLLSVACPTCTSLLTSAVRRTVRPAEPKGRCWWWPLAAGFHLDDQNRLAPAFPSPML